MLNKESNQNIEGISNSNVNQAGGNVTVINNGLQLGDILPLLDSLVAKKIDDYVAQGLITAKERRDEFGKSLVDALRQNSQDKLFRFNEPSIQYTTRRAALGYIKTGDKEQGEALIDLLLERLNSEEQSTIQNLIDKAIDVLPTLSNNSLKLLILLAYRDLTFQGTRNNYEKWLKSINPILEGVQIISALDIAYLQQSECTLGLTNLFPHEHYEKELLGKEDLYYRHIITGGQYKEFLRLFELLETPQGIVGFKSPNEFMAISSVIMSHPQERYAIVNVCSTATLANALEKPTYHDIKDKILKAVKLGPPFTVEEVKSSLIDTNTQWNYALNILNRDDVLTLRPTLLGYYIACRRLSKLSGQPISLDIFYKG